MKNYSITFHNQREPAQVVVVDPDAPCADVRQLLHLEQPRVLLLVVGGAGNMEDTLKKDLYPLCRDGIATLALEKSALVVDGGTQSGIMELIGQAASVQDPRPPLLGVAPEGAVTYPGAPEAEKKAYHLPLDPNHTCFVLVQGKRWGDETPMLHGLASELAGTHPVITLLLNGGEIAKREVLQSTRENWPVIVITGSGRLADKIARWWQKKCQPASFLRRISRKTDISSAIHDQALVEIIQEGEIYLFPYDGEVADFKRLVENLCFLREHKALVNAWKRCSSYEQLATRHQRNFKRLQTWILGLSIATTVLALANIQAQMRGWITQGTGWELALRILTTLVSFVFTALVGLASMVKWGSKWVSFRASAEALKREMYYFRTHTSDYSEQALPNGANGTQLAAEKHLTKKMSAISSQVMQTQTHLAPDSSSKQPLPPSGTNGDRDDGLSDLTPAQYIRFRLKDQFDYYRRHAKRWKRVLARYQILVILLGAVGTVLAAFGLGLWLPLTTVLIALFILHVEQMRAVTIITKYTQAATDLESVRQWWLMLSTEEQKAVENIRKLVTSTEQILENEQSSWLQQMYDALTELYKEPGKA